VLQPGDILTWYGKTQHEGLRAAIGRIQDLGEHIVKQAASEGAMAVLPLSAAARGLARATEHLEDAASSIIARRKAAELAGLGDDTIPVISTVGPQEGWIIGRQSPDGLRGWRMDWDNKKGYHVNWWDRTGGAKRDDWIYGAITIVDGTWDDYIELLKHGFGN
jgi:hypothetical protein